MLAVKSMDVRDNFKSICEKAVSGETIIVSRKRNQNVVIVSEAEYNSLLKSKQNEQYLQMLDQSIAEAAQGGFVTKSLDDLEAYSQ